eukprot:TRINITY_DN90826_c0_g1_i1.p1 TRINITY_DN90826_c0_g1~~TRINITY_DN90826_c0_g1_i1.p1  ORF type:complete len:659 (+),score=83.10 TRINITY_DN90826_c0_g1_i1:42-2018(+)
MANAASPSREVRANKVPRNQSSPDTLEQGSGDKGESAFSDSEEDGPDSAVHNFCDEEDLGYTPSSLPRHCTDVFWMPVYILALAAMVYAAVQVLADFEKVEQAWVGRDWKFRPCGSGANEGKPYVFFCLNGMTAKKFEVDDKQLNTEYPQCVAQCPQSWTETASCYIGNGVYENIQTYSSRPRGTFCEPVRGTAGNTIFMQLSTFYVKNRTIFFLRAQFLREWQILLGICFFTVILATLYAALVARYVSQLVWTGLTCIVLMPLGTGAHLLWCSKSGGCNYPVPENTLGYICIAFGVVLICVISGASDNIKRAIVCMHWSCKAVSEISSLKLLPLIKTLCSLAVVASHAALFIFVGSRWYSHRALSGNQLDGQYASGLGALVVLCIWNVGIVHQVNSFAMVYAVQVWFFNGGMASKHSVAKPSLLRGYWFAYRYHFGTCVYAGLVSTLALPVRLPLELISGSVLDESSHVGAILGTCCTCCVNVYLDFLAGLQTQALFDTVLQGTSWCQAATHSTAIMFEEGSVGRILKGATWIFEVAGLSSFGVLGYIMSYLVATKVPQFADEDSQTFVATPGITAWICFILGIICSHPFMDLFRISSDVILYSRTVEKQRAWRGPGSEKGTGGGSCTDEFGYAFEALLCMDRDRPPALHPLDKFSS